MSYLRVALVVVALVAILGVPEGADASKYHIRAHLKKFFNDAKDVIVDMEKCVTGKGVPKDLASKAKECGTKAAGDTKAYVKCAGLEAFPDAVKSLKCFAKAVKDEKKSKKKA